MVKPLLTIQLQFRSRNMSTPLLTRIRRTNLRSLGFIVTRFACIAHRFISSIRRTSQASMASWMANKAEAWNRRPILKSCVISLTNLATHNFRQSSSMLFWNFLICQSATVPGQYLWGFLIAPVEVLLFLAGLAGIGFRGAFAAPFWYSSSSTGRFRFAALADCLVADGQCRERVIFATALLLTGHLLFWGGRLTSPSSTPRSGSRGGDWSSTTSPCSFLFLFNLFKFFERWRFFLLHAKVRNTLVKNRSWHLLYLIPEYDHFSFYSYLYQVLFHSTYRLLTLMAVGYQLYQWLQFL